MSLSSFPLPAPSPDRLRDAIRRSLPLGLAVVLHIAVVALLLRTPPAELLRIASAAERLDVRFYTVSADDAESDARLVEPPLAEMDAEPASVEPAPVSEPETPAIQPDTPDTDVDEVPTEPIDPVTASLDDSAAERNSELSDGRTGNDAGPANASAIGGSQTGSSIGQALNGPLATTQITPPAPRARPSPPSFADILARTETRLDPADFQIALSLNGVAGTVRESLCLSSSQANLEAGDCPEGPNARSAELARFGLQALGEASPEFIEDMDRMAFQLRQLGANPAQVERIMLALSEARRDAIETPGVTRAMQRDAQSRTDNLGNPISSPD